MVLLGPSLMDADASQWWALGGRVARGDWMLRPVGDGAWEPLYPWLVGLLRRTSSRPRLVLTCLQAFFWTATMIIASSLSGQIARRAAAPFLAIGTGVFLITSVLWTTTLSPLPLMSFLLVLHLWQVVMLVHRPGLGRALLAAMSIGLLALAVQDTLWLGALDVVYVLASLLWPVPGDRARRLWGTTLIGLALVLIPMLGLRFFSPSEDPTRDWPQTVYNKARAQPKAYARQWADQAQTYWTSVSEDVPLRVKGERVLPEIDNGEGNENELDGDELSWSVSIPIAGEVSRYRLSQYSIANAILAILTLVSVLWMVIRRNTRAAGLWLGLVLVYFQTAGGELGKLGYEDRLITEPLILTIIVVAFSTLLFAPRKSTKPHPDSNRAPS